MPKIFPAKIIYRAIRAGVEDMPSDLFEWVTLKSSSNKFARWDLHPAVQAALKFQYPILRRCRRGFIPWAPDEGIVVMSLHELWYEWDDNDRPQPSVTGVISDGTFKRYRKDETLRGDGVFLTVQRGQVWPQHQPDQADR